MISPYLPKSPQISPYLALMAEASAKAVKTCTIGFDQAALDETAYAQQIAERFATDHRTRTVAAGDFALCEAIWREAAADPIEAGCACFNGTVCYRDTDSVQSW